MAEVANIAEEIKSRADIADVIGRVVSLKRSGSRMVGLCPFHNEKTPSFFVNDDTQSFICFGCGAKGDVISFYERYYNLNFLEAAEKLAGEYGIEWAPGGYDGDAKKKDELYAVNREAARYFRNAIKVAGNPAYAYMAGRGVTGETMRAFGIGYADAGRSGLCAHLKQAGLSLERAAEIGLILGEKGGYRDRYYNRVMFPIVNTRRKVIGFGGRILGDGNPKYLNSAESRIFLKKNNLYAIDITKDEIVKEGFSILVEGYMDVISLYQHGVRNVTASLGTALTAAQARVLKRYANNTILAYDADAAGVDAALRGMDLLRDAGLRVKVLVLSDTKDPDEFVRKYGRDAFLDAAKEAVPFIDFKLSVARKRHDLTAAEGSVAFLREAAGILRKLSPVESDYYIKKLSEDTGIGEGAIRTETWGDHASGSVAAGGAGGASRGAPYGAPYGAPNGGPEFERNPHGGAVPRRGGADANGGGPVDEAALAIQRNLIRLVLYDGAFLEEVRPYDGIFVTPPLYRIFKGVTALAARDPGADIDRKALDEILDDEAGRALADIMERVLLGEDPARQLDDCIAQMKIRTLSEREREIRDVLGIGAEGDAHTSDLMKQLKEVQDLIFEIKDR